MNENPNNNADYPKADRNRTLSEKASLDLEAYIEEQGLTPGSRIPSERQIGEMLGVSRTVVREAVRLLVARGLVASRMGSGTYIQKLTPSRVISEPMAMLLRNGAISSEHMIEARNLVEPEISALAALRATESDVRSLESTIEVLSESSATNEECARADAAFHSGIATATGNPLLQALLVSLDEVVYEVCLRGYKEHPKARQRVRGYHMAILSSVKEGDQAGARRYMDAHIGYTATSSRLYG